jgi:hypothetical protein
MALKFCRWIVIVTTLVVFLAMPGSIYTCGPFLQVATFTPGREPSVSQEDFAAGKFGIFLPTFRDSYLIVAYRYLTGLKFDDEQQQDAIDVWNRKVGNDAYSDVAEIEAWRQARGKVAGLPPEPKYERYARRV